MDEKRQLIYASAGIVALGLAAGLTYYFVARRKAKRNSQTAESVVMSFSSVSGSPPSSISPQSIADAVALFEKLPEGSYPIRMNDKSKRAFILQAALKQIGYDVDVDGIAGRETFDAVKRLDDWVKRTYPTFVRASFTSTEIPKEAVGQIINRLQLSVKTPKDAAIVSGLKVMFNNYP